MVRGNLRSGSEASRRDRSRAGHKSGSDIPDFEFATQAEFKNQCHFLCLWRAYLKTMPCPNIATFFIAKEGIAKDQGD
jgi:hypothetical protein